MFTDIYRAGALWEFDPRVMKDATIMHNEIIRSLSKQMGGYEVHKALEADGEGTGPIYSSFNLTVASKARSASHSSGQMMPSVGR